MGTSACLRSWRPLSAGVCALVVASLLATAYYARADTVVLVSSESNQQADDSVAWSQLGANGTSLGASFAATSVSHISVTGTLSGSGSLIAVVCPVSPSSCSWESSGFTAGDSLIWTSDNENGGNGPLTLAFGTSVAGAGALIQADGPAQFTAQIQAFNGGTSLGTFTVTSDTNGDATYIGVLDQTAANISSVVFNITSCEGNCADFGIDTLELATTVTPPTPTPTSTPTPPPTSTPTPPPTSTATPSTTPTPTATPTTVPGKLVIRPAKLLFPRGQFAHGGTSSPYKTVTLVNPKKRYQPEISLTDLVISEFANDFGGTTDCGQVLYPGEHCHLFLEFTPQGLGLRTGTLEIFNNGLVSPKQVALKGNAIAPHLVYRPRRLGFGKWPIGVTSSARTVTVVNRSHVGVDVQNMELSGAYSSDFAGETDCPLAGVLASGVLCHVWLTFTPSQPVKEPAALVITDDAAKSPQMVKLIGRGHY